MDEALIKQVDESKVLMIQTVWRGYRARLFVSLLKKATKLKKKYFLEEEYWETVSTAVSFPVTQIA